MPPKKNNNVVLFAENKINTRRSSKKPALKPSAVLKIKLPASVKQTPVKDVAEITIKSEPITKYTRKKLKQIEEINLANEVAMAQFDKPSTEIIQKPLEVQQLKKPRKRKLKNDSADVTNTAPRALRRKKAEAITDVITIKPEVLEPLPKAETKTLKSTPKKASRPRRTKGKLIKKLEELITDDNISPSILDQITIGSQIPNNNSKQKYSEKLNEECVSVGSIQSRKTSTNSDCLSWTKCISSSSTTTCVTVCSVDVVCIDGKMPVLRIDDINHKRQTGSRREGEHSLSESESSANESSQCLSIVSNLSPDPCPISQSLNLSVSSPSSSVSKNHENNNSNDINTQDTDFSRRTEAMRKMSHILKSFDKVFLNWIVREEEDSGAQVYQEKILNHLKIEKGIIQYCRNLNRIFADDDQVDGDERTDNLGNDDRLDDLDNTDKCSSPVQILNRVEADRDMFANRDDCPSKTSDLNLDGAVNNDKSFEYISNDANDDDDALSLYAESITGIESSKMSCSNASATNADHNCIEEYVPQPVAKSTWRSSISYHPTKVNNEDRVQDLVHNNLQRKIVCEKQNADSTSISKKSNNIEQVDDVVTNANLSKLNNLHLLSHNKNIGNIPTKCVDRPLLLMDRFTAVNCVKSVVFRHVCFFNLISNCKRSNCNFPHRDLTIFEVKNRLTSCKDIVVITEYMLMRSWPDIRRKYLMCFLEECVRRNLVRVLVEMAIDSITRANVSSKEDAILKEVVVERTLLYLNEKDSMNLCEDLLKCDLGNNTLLCDELMQGLAETPNFSRFKEVFIKLTHFMVSIDRVFHFDVATNILERVCILPADESLAGALFSIIKWTDKRIFENGMMFKFEDQLSKLNLGMYEEFMKFKERFGVAGSAPALPSPRSSQGSDRVATTTAVRPDEECRFGSPDTTNVDNSVRTGNEFIITRTLHMNPYFGAHNGRPRCPSPSSPEGFGSDRGFCPGSMGASDRAFCPGSAAAPDRGFCPGSAAAPDRGFCPGSVGGSDRGFCPGSVGGSDRGFRPGPARGGGGRGGGFVGYNRQPSSPQFRMPMWRPVRHSPPQRRAAGQALPKYPRRNGPQ